MKQFNKKQYSYPELTVLEMNTKDLLSISDAYDNDVFDPISWGGQNV